MLNTTCNIPALYVLRKEDEEDLVADWYQPIEYFLREKKIDPSLMYEVCILATAFRSRKFKNNLCSWVVAECEISSLVDVLFEFKKTEVLKQRN
jgi:hypothetical protein